VEEVAELQRQLQVKQRDVQATDRLMGLDLPHEKRARLGSVQFC